MRRIGISGKEWKKWGVKKEEYEDVYLFCTLLVDIVTISNQCLSHSNITHLTSSRQHLAPFKPFLVVVLSPVCQTLGPNCHAGMLLGPFASTLFECLVVPYSFFHLFCFPLSSSMQAQQGFRCILVLLAFKIVSRFY